MTRSEGCIIRAVKVAVQSVEEVTVTSYDPADNPEIVFPEPVPVVAVPCFCQLYILVPTALSPVVVKFTDPLVPPKQEGFVTVWEALKSQRIAVLNEVVVVRPQGSVTDTVIIQLLISALAGGVNTNVWVDASGEKVPPHVDSHAILRLLILPPGIVNVNVLPSPE